jgi:hypothetical protein
MFNKKPDYNLLARMLHEDPGYWEEESLSIPIDVPPTVNCPKCGKAMVEWKPGLPCYSCDTRKDKN